MRRYKSFDFNNDRNAICAQLSSDSKPGRASQVMLRVIRDGLTDKQRACISMYYGRNMNQQEIGRELCLDKSTVSRHLKAGRDKIREIMELSGVTEDIRFFN